MAASSKGLSWIRTTVTIGEPNGIWSRPGNEQLRGVRLELIHNRYAGRIEARLFDQQGFQLREAVVTEHSVDGASATIRTGTGETWQVEKDGDCGCG